MPVVLRFLGAVLAVIVTLLSVWLMLPVLALATTLLNGVLFPIIAAGLVLIFFSYIFTYALRLSGNANNTSGPFALSCAIVYLIACTCVILITVVYIILYLMAMHMVWYNLLLLVLLIGVIALILFIAPYAMLVLLGYIFAAIFAPVLGQVEDPRECFFRGALIGGNTVMNAVLGLIFYSWLFLPLHLTNPASPLAGIATTTVVLIVTLATSLTLIPSTTFYLPPQIAGNVQNFVKAYAGYLSWLLPMSWGYCIVYWIVFYINWFVHLLIARVTVQTLIQYPYLRLWKIVALRIDTQTGVMVTDGGALSNYPPPYPCNAGCFSFIPLDYTSAVSYLDDARIREHESGHALNLAAFGTIFHMINTINEDGLESFGIYGPEQGIYAYGDRLAQSNVDYSLIQLNINKSRPEVQIWR